MPLPLAPLILAGASLAGGAANAASTARQNKKSRQWSDQQYQRQRDDNIAFWRMQNAYNDPTQQMERLRNAGINPAVMYGGSASGAAGVAGSISTASAPTPQFQSNRLGDSLQDAAGVGINSVYDLQRKDLENSNLKKQNNVLHQDAALRAAQIHKTLAETDLTKFNTQYKKKIEHVSAEAAAESLRQLKQRTVIEGLDSDRRGVRLSMDFDQLGPKINQIRAQTQNTKLDSRLKTLESELQSMGMSRDTPVYFRLLGRMLQMDPKFKRFFNR